MSTQEKPIRSPRADSRWSTELLPWLLPLAGVLVGSATSFGQGWFDDPWSSLFNAASPWLLVAWLVGLAHRDPRHVALAGALTCIGEVFGYYATASLRGFGVANSFVMFWAAAAVVAGPLFGMFGWATRQPERPTLRSIGAAAPAATFLGEAVGSYWLRLDYTGQAVLFAVIGLAALVAGGALSPTRTMHLVAASGATVAGVIVYGPLLSLV